jgi:hypothetical protein
MRIYMRLIPYKILLSYIKGDTYSHLRVTCIFYIGIIVGRKFKDRKLDWRLAEWY